MIVLVVIRIVRVAVTSVQIRIEQSASDKPPDKPSDKRSAVKTKRPSEPAKPRAAKPRPAKPRPAKTKTRPSEAESESGTPEPESRPSEPKSGPSKLSHITICFVCVFFIHNLGTSKNKFEMITEYSAHQFLIGRLSKK